MSTAFATLPGTFFPLHPFLPSFGFLNNPKSEARGFFWLLFSRQERSTHRPCSKTSEMFHVSPTAERFRISPLLESLVLVLSEKCAHYTNIHKPRGKMAQIPFFCTTISPPIFYIARLSFMPECNSGKHRMKAVDKVPTIKIIVHQF